MALIFHHGTFLGSRPLGLLAAGGVFLLGAGLAVSMVPVLRQGIRLLEWTLDRIGLGQRPRSRQLLSKLARAVEAFSRIKPPTVLKISAISVVQWLLTFGSFFAIMRAFSMPVGILQTTLGSTAAVVTSFLPVGGIGSFGPMEAGWSLGFVLVGLERTAAIASGFGVSIVTFCFGALFGGIGWIGLRAGARASADGADRGE
jgi:uncharacterized membrane protein YbhN (UPF0104 family)